MRKIFIILILSFSSIAGGIALADEPKSFTTKSGYPLYKEQLQNYCSEYKQTSGDREIIMILNESKYFKDLDKNKPEGFKVGSDLDFAKKEYSKNMDAIYDCATYSSYYRALKLIKEDLIKKNPKLSSKLKAKIDKKMKEIDQKINKLDGKCKNKNKKNNLVKEAVLRQTTYETCKYKYYLEYLKNRAQNVENLVDIESTKNIQNLEISKKFKNQIESINIEIDKSLRAFKIAFQAYVDYENHIGNHILLELLLEDYKLFRLGLHKTLNPINQVIYKISNATRK